MSLTLNVVTTVVSPEFEALARKYRLTPAFLASLVCQTFTANAPDVLPEIESRAPLNEQDCESCPLLGRCSASERREPERLICFENLTGLTSGAGAVQFEPR
jgi:hypothetical protein